MNRTYTNHIQADGSSQYVETRQDGLQRIVDADHPTLLAWLAAGNIAQVIPYISPPGPTQDEAKAAQKATVTAKRQEIEAAGMILSGMHIATTKDDQNRIAGAKIYLAEFPEKAIDWKAQNGWVEVGKAQVDAIAAAVGGRVQALFSAEKAHHLAIEAITWDDAVERVQAYDITTGWPE